MKNTLIGLTCLVSWKNRVQIFCCENDLKVTNLAKSLFVWWIGLPMQDRLLFLEKYESYQPRTPNKDKTSLAIAWGSIEEKKEVEKEFMSVKLQRGDNHLSFTTIITSLLEWFMKLSPEDHAKFIEKYYLRGKKRGLAALQNNVVLNGGPLDAELTDTNKEKQANVILNRIPKKRKKVKVLAE